MHYFDALDFLGEFLPWKAEIRSGGHQTDMGERAQAAVVLRGRVLAREQMETANLVRAGGGGGVGERPAKVPVPVAQVAPTRGAGLILR